MPGPLSTPNGWRGKEHWNHTTDHGVTGFLRCSGKTRWDKEHGKWANTQGNKARRAEENIRGPKR